MSLTSPLFFLLLAPAVFLFYTLPNRLRAVYLLALCYAFYLNVSPIYLLLMIVASAGCYSLGLGIATSRDDRTKSILFFAGVTTIVAVVCAFKAAGEWKGVLLPLGISYYSFKLLSYLIEVFWDEAAVERDPVIFFIFPAFFPQIVSGPIQRPDAFFGQMREVMRRRADGAQIAKGLALILGGLMLKMIIGDRLGAFVAMIDRNPSQYQWSVVLVTVGSYILQLFADFAGYTNIALGVGLLLGIEGPPNFNAPFSATNIQLYWRRWHMSLTHWLTDYLFTPLSMSLRNYGQAGVAMAITVNMVVIGLWHGFTLNYLIFGLLQALYLNVTVLVTSKLARSKSRRPKGGAPVPQVRGWEICAGGVGAVVTFVLVSFSQIFFVSPTFTQALSIVDQLFGITHSGPVGWSDLGTDVAIPALLCMAVSLFVGSGYPGTKHLFAWADAVTPAWVQYGFALFLLTVLSTEGSGTFTYGQF